MQQQLPLKQILISSIMLLLACFLCTGCSKKSNTPGSGSRFKAADFRISNMAAIQDNDNVYVSYDVTNTTSMDYDNNNDGSFRIKINVNTTDGVKYENNSTVVLRLSAATTASESMVIELSSGKTANLSTLKYEVYAD